MATQIVPRTPGLPVQTFSYEQDASGWDQYVRAHPKGSAFHLTNMLAAFAHTPKHQVHAYAARNVDGQIIAMFAAVRVSTLGGLAGRYSSRSILYAEPICDMTPLGAAGLEQLVTEHDQRFRSTTLFAEIRNIMQATQERVSLEGCGYEFSDYLNYIVDTRQTHERLWGQLSKSIRKKINRSERRGLKIEVASTHDGIDRMYPFLKTSYRRSRVPLVDIALFHEAIDRLDGLVQIRLATFQGKDVAGGIGIVFGDRFFAWYGGSERNPGIEPFSCLTWDEIRWCSENGVAHYDFGGAGWPNEEYGPRDFKAKFGGELVRYGRYRKVYRRFTLPIAKTTYYIARRFLSV